MSNALTLYTSAEDDFADVRQRDIIMPKIRLQQLTSKGVIDGKYKMGQFADTAQDVVAIDLQKVGRIVPLVFWLEWLEWNTDRSAPKDKLLIGRSTDPQSKLADEAGRFVKVMTDKGEKLKVTEVYNFICLLPSYSGNFVDPFLVSFGKSGHQAGKAWLNKLMKAKIKVGDALIKAPMWANEWEISSLKEQKDGNTFAVPVIGASTMVPSELHEQVSELSSRFKMHKAELMAKNSEAHDDNAEPSTPADADEASKHHL